MLTEKRILLTAFAYSTIYINVSRCHQNDQDPCDYLFNHLHRPLNRQLLPDEAVCACQAAISKVPNPALWMCIGRSTNGGIILPCLLKSSGSTTGLWDLPVSAVISIQNHNSVSRPMMETRYQLRESLAMAVQLRMRRLEDPKFYHSRYCQNLCCWRSMSSQMRLCWYQEQTVTGPGGLRFTI